jgi:hypothetical protein
MTTLNKSMQRQMCLAAFLFVLPSLACANADNGLTYGSGPDGFRSYAFKANADLAETLEFNLDYFFAKATGVANTREIGAGLTWYATELASGNYRFSVINDGTFEVKGNEGGLSFALDTLWQGELRTSLDLGYGAFKYKIANPQTILASNFELTQNRSSFGLSQDLASSFTVYGSHDKYKYDRNLDASILLLLRNRPLLLSRKLALLAFPDKTNTLGITWKTTDALSIDLSSAKTTTLLEQEQKSTKLAVDYQIGDRLSIAAAVTRVSNSAILGPLGGTVQPATQDTYSEFSVGWGF